MNPIKVVAIVLIMLLTFTNMTGLKTSKFIQNTFTFTKTAALLGLVVVGLTIGWKVGLRDGSLRAPPAPHDIPGAAALKMAGA